MTSTQRPDSVPAEYQPYRRVGLTWLRPYVDGESMDGISLSPADQTSGHPKAGGFIAINPENPLDRWYITADYVKQNLAQVLPCFKYPFDPPPEDPDEPYPDWARPVPPLTIYEAHLLLHAIIDKAAKQPLDEEDCFLHGQLTNVFKQAVQAHTLKGDTGRYFVVSEATLKSHWEEIKASRQGQTNQEPTP